MQKGYEDKLLYFDLNLCRTNRQMDLNNIRSNCFMCRITGLCNNQGIDGRWMVVIVNVMVNVIVIIIIAVNMNVNG